MCLTICHFDDCVKFYMLSLFWFRIAQHNIFIQVYCIHLTIIHISPPLSLCKTVNAIRKHLNFFSKQYFVCAVILCILQFPEFVKNEMCCVAHTLKPPQNVRAFQFCLQWSPFMCILSYFVAHMRVHLFYYACVRLTDNPK